MEAGDGCRHDTSTVPASSPSCAICKNPRSCRAGLESSGSERASCMAVGRDGERLHDAAAGKVVGRDIKVGEGDGVDAGSGSADRCPDAAGTDIRWEQDGRGSPSAQGAAGEVSAPCGWPSAMTSSELGRASAEAVTPCSANGPEGAQRRRSRRKQPPSDNSRHGRGCSAGTRGLAGRCTLP